MKDREQKPESDRARQIDQDLQKSEKELGPQQHDPARFPESILAKNPRKDTEDHPETNKDESVTDDLARDVTGHVGSRATGSTPDDIAGVADVDRGLRRRRRGVD